MSLAKLAPRTVVTISDGEGGSTDFPVRGLSLADIRALMVEDGGSTIHLLYQQAVSSLVQTDGEVFGQIVGEALDKVPDLVAKAIARGLDMPDQWEEVLDAPVGAQMDLLEAIYTRTFTSERMAKKVWETVRQYAASRMTSPLSDSKTGSGV